MNKSNFRMVREWMEKVGQEVFPAATILSPDRKVLRHKLLREESEEALEAINQCDGSPESMAQVAKELGDVLVVTYGALVAMGLDGDQVFEIVHQSNEMKLGHLVMREDGKAIVPDERKAEIKAWVNERLEALCR